MATHFACPIHSVRKSRRLWELHQIRQRRTGHSWRKNRDRILRNDGRNWQLRSPNYCFLLWWGEKLQGWDDGLRLHRGKQQYHYLALTASYVTCDGHSATRATCLITFGQVTSTRGWLRTATVRLWTERKQVVGETEVLYLQTQEAINCNKKYVTALLQGFLTELPCTKQSGWPTPVIKRVTKYPCWYVTSTSTSRIYPPPPASHMTHSKHKNTQS